jgi:glyoxylase I family protein
VKLGIEHLGLAARDPVALAQWYQRILGAETVSQLSAEPPAVMLRLPGGLLLEIYAAALSVAEIANNQCAGWRHLALQVDSLEGAQRWLANRGVTFAEPVKPAGGGGRVLFFRDLEGNLLHLVERLTDSVFRLGAA